MCLNALLDKRLVPNTGIGYKEISIRRGKQKRDSNGRFLPGKEPIKVMCGSNFPKYELPLNEWVTDTNTQKICIDTWRNIKYPAGFHFYENRQEDTVKIEYSDVVAYGYQGNKVIVAKKIRRIEKVKGE